MKTAELTLIFDNMIRYCFVSVCIFWVSSCSISQTVPTTSTNEKNLCEQIPVGPEGINPHRIDVLSWNIYKGKKPGWDDDLTKLLSPSTVGLLQEASLPSIASFLRSQGYPWHFAPGYKSGKTQTGVLTTSAVEAYRKCTFTHKEPWLKTPKAALITYYKLEEKDVTLLVANVHGINFTFGVAAYTQQLRDLASIIKLHRGPVILGGDMNSWSAKRNDVIEQLLIELNLSEVRFISNWRKAFFGHPLDRIFYRGLELVNLDVYRLGSSDHNPITVTFRLSKR